MNGSELKKEITATMKWIVQIELNLNTMKLSSISVLVWYHKFMDRILSSSLYFTALFFYWGVYLPVSKTEEEIQEILNRKEAQLKDKDDRRRKQEQNVAQKKEKWEENK